MNSVIIFDVDAHQGNIREGLRARGYHITWSVIDPANANNKKTYNLPSNTAWKPNIESAQAIQDLNDVINQLNISLSPSIRLLRCIVLNSTPWSGIIGEPIV